MSLGTKLGLNIHRNKDYARDPYVCLAVIESEANSSESATK